MNVILASLGGLGGIVAFIGGCYFIIRSVYKLINATQENTRALFQARKSIEDLKATVDQHTIDIAVLKDRDDRPEGGRHAV
jgi:hypothetical protein